MRVPLNTEDSVVSSSEIGEMYYCEQNGSKNISLHNTHRCSECAGVAIIDADAGGGIHEHFADNAPEISRDTRVPQLV